MNRQRRNTRKIKTKQRSVVTHKPPRTKEKKDVFFSFLLCHHLDDSHIHSGLFLVHRMRIRQSVITEWLFLINVNKLKIGCHFQLGFCKKNTVSIACSSINHSCNQLGNIVRKHSFDPSKSCNAQPQKSCLEIGKRIHVAAIKRQRSRITFVKPIVVLQPIHSHRSLAIQPKHGWTVGSATLRSRKPAVGMRTKQNRFWISYSFARLDDRHFIHPNIVLFSALHRILQKIMFFDTCDTQEDAALVSDVAIAQKAFQRCKLFSAQKTLATWL